MEMFSRSEESYHVADNIIQSMIEDKASPISLISEIIPENSSVLDIGSGSGVLARAFLLKGKHISIEGIEPNSYAADLAQQYYDELYVGFAQEFYDIISSKHYDYVVMVDVIEHMVDPQKFLLSLCECMKKRTRIIVSLPNIAFGGVRLTLLRGSFEYTGSGLLEATHLRFFTHKTANRLFEESGLHINKLHKMNRSFYRCEFKREDMASGPMTVLSLALDESSLAYQYVFELDKGDKYIVPNIINHGAGSFVVAVDYLLGHLMDMLSNHLPIKSYVKRIFKRLTG